jgi:hypothetical protein
VAYPYFFPSNCDEVIIKCPVWSTNIQRLGNHI